MCVFRANKNYYSLTKGHNYKIIKIMKEERENAFETGLNKEEIIRKTIMVDENFEKSIELIDNISEHLDKTNQYKFKIGLIVSQLKSINTQPELASRLSILEFYLKSIL